ncbi:hypothetical protein QYM36_001741 [Artemia franciscana]|uniref:Reverse transcriptase domain-containing protein n=1 Tax=Artemia franciscana TaxID=6661 RepID=A0AA88LE47_ARTSF|nr:hypothetical protein QYM36_001741 [Artemia franciscana]
MTSDNELPILFADDTAISLKAGNEEDLRMALETVAFNVNSWFNGNRLIPNLEKSEFVIFGRILRAVKCVSFKTIGIGASSIKRVDVFRYLGIYIDSTLSFKAHINKLGQHCYGVVQTSTMISESSSLLSNKLREDTHYDWLGNELDNIKAEMLTFVIPLTKSEREQADKENFINLKCEIYRTDENKVEIDHEGNSICCDHVEIVKSGSSEDLKSPSSEGSFFNDIMNTLNKKLETNDVNDEVEDKVSDKNKKERLQLDLEPLLDEDGAESLDNFPSANTPVSVATTSVPIEDKKSGKLKR